jgi:anti-anti-sigma regulatory factor
MDEFVSFEPAGGLRQLRVAFKRGTCLREEETETVAGMLQEFQSDAAYQHFFFDMDGVDHISGAFLGLLGSLSRWARQKRTNVLVFNAANEVAELLDIVDMYRYLLIADTWETAQAFAPFRCTDLRVPVAGLIIAHPRLPDDGNTSILDCCARELSQLHKCACKVLLIDWQQSVFMSSSLLGSCHQLLEFTRENRRHLLFCGVPDSIREYFVDFECEGLLLETLHDARRYLD